ncbi:MAG: hypothetical protein GX041_06655 [Clostridiales bacterium]|jgi:DNA-binding transcriptional MerR regulator|nr:hypothetical protein [Clostridiales bacterium]
MVLAPVGYKYTVIPKDNDKYLAVMIISEHDNYSDALKAALDAMRKEADEIMNREIETLRKHGIKVASVKEAIKDMTPEQRKRFLEERKSKLINPLLDLNIEMLKQERKKLGIKREE